MTTEAAFERRMQWDYSLLQALVEKLPVFDPNWSDEHRAQWLAWCADLMEEAQKLEAARVLRPTPLAPWTREELAREIDAESWTKHDRMMKSAARGTFSDREAMTEYQVKTTREDAAGLVLSSLAIAGRILSRPAPTVCPEADKQDAERFRALMRCGKIKMQGSSGVDPHTLERNGNNVHFGAEFWPQPPKPEYIDLDGGHRSTEWGRACLRHLADAILEREALAAAPLPPLQKAEGEGT